MELSKIAVYMELSKIAVCLELYKIVVFLELSECQFYRALQIYTLETLQSGTFISVTKLQSNLFKTATQK